MNELVNAGYSVRALLRYPDSFDLSHERLGIIEGDARDPSALRQLLQTCGALISTLGHPKGESTPIMSTCMKRIIDSMPIVGVKRLIVVSSLFDTGTERLDEPTRQAAAYMEQHFPTMMADRRAEFNQLRQSELDWTYVRIPYLVPEPPTGHVAVNLDYLPGTSITATDLARFLVSQIDDSRYVRKALFVANSAATTQAIPSASAQVR